MKQIERLRVVAKCDTDSAMRHFAYSYVEEDADGDYVAFEDHKRAVDALEARVEEERSYIDNAVSKAPEPLRQLGEYLAGLLDEDQWPHAERYLNAAAIAAEAAERALAETVKERDALRSASTIIRQRDEAVEVLKPFADLDHEEEAAASLLGARDGNAAVRVPRRHLRQARAFLTKRGEK